MTRKALIEICTISESDPLEFEVRLGEPNGQTCHRVALSMSDYRRLHGTADPTRLIEAAFRFLLDREPQESILRRFNLAVIGRYFPEFESELPSYLSSVTPSGTGDPAGAPRR